MRIRWGLVASVLTCTALLTAFKDEMTSAQAVPNPTPGAEYSNSTVRANEGNAAETLAPGDFRFTTGLDKEPQHIQGPVRCDTRDGIHRIAIGDPNAGGVEIGLYQSDSVLRYVDLGNRNGVNLALVNDGDGSGEMGDKGKAPPVVRKTGNTYFASGYARGLTAGQVDTGLYFQISVACP